MKMEVNKTIKEDLANLTKISDVNNVVRVEFDDLVISTLTEEYIPETTELWANHATIQQIFAPDRYNFKFENKNWRDFVRGKLNKKHNLLLIATTKDSPEVKGFLYLQSVTIPSSDLILKGVIEDLYTKPQHRRKGIAMKLLEVAIKFAEENKIRSVEFVSMTNSKSVSDLHRKFISTTNYDVDFELVNF